MPFFPFQGELGPPGPEGPPGPRGDPGNKGERVSFLTAQDYNFYLFLLIVQGDGG